MQVSEDFTSKPREYAWYQLICRGFHGVGSGLSNNLSSLVMD